MGDEKDALIEELKDRLEAAERELTRLRSIVGGRSMDLIQIANDLLRASMEPPRNAG